MNVGTYFHDIRYSEWTACLVFTKYMYSMMTFLTFQLPSRTVSIVINGHSFIREFTKDSTNKTTSDFDSSET